MTSRHTVHDIIESACDAGLLHARANLAAFRAERGADATAETTATAATTDPNTANQVSTESLEHAARELESAGQTNAAVSAWLQAACSHSRLGNHAGVVQSVTHAAHLSGNRTFAPFVSKKGTGDAANPDGEVYGDDDDQVQPKATATPPDPADGESFGDEQTEHTSVEG